MTEQQEAPPARGPLAQRPAADAVPAGFVYDCDDAPQRWRSDGAQWWDATAETDGWRLAYAEDLLVGEHVRRLAEIPLPQAPKPQGVMAFFQQAPFAGCGHMHLPEWVILMERRDAGDLLACIGVRPNGEQVPLYLGRLELVQVRVEAGP